jgi:hypothetical protein
MRLVVKLHERICSCREWQVSDILCVDAIAFITLLENEPLNNYVDMFYSVDEFQSAYACEFLLLMTSLNGQNIIMDFSCILHY